jgi:hypothetical protein
MNGKGWFFLSGPQRRAGRGRLGPVLAALFLTAASAVTGPAPVAKAPPWLQEEANRALPSLSPETEAVVLLDEQTTTVNAKGALLKTCRLATRVLRPAAVDAARRLVRVGSYDTKVRSMTGWVLKPTGETRQATMKQAFSSSLAPDTLYMDARIIWLVLPEVEAGSVVGFEWEEERTPPSLEDSFDFQGSFPVLRASYSLTLPPLWTAEFRAVNWNPVEPRRDQTDPLLTTLEISEIPAVAEEPYMPDEGALAGRFVVGIKPADPDPRSFASWTDMAAWYDALSRNRCLPNQFVSVRAEELAAEAPDALDKIRVLAGYVQKEIRYVSIQIGIGGFQPHPAPDVLRNRYGDCKDKATLLSAMLRAVGIESFPVLVHTERGFVTPDSSVSLYSFNHAILAIRLPDGVSGEGLDAVVEHAGEGRLLVFDPTMPTTPLGRLPFYLQDNTALLVGKGGGGLIRLPRPRPESNLLERKGRLTLTGDGALSGEIEESRRGSMADSLRYAMQAGSEADRRKYLETFLSLSFASFNLEEFEFENLENAGADLLVRYRFTSPSYAKRAGGFLVVRPRAVGQKAIDLTSRRKQPRRHPIDLETTALSLDEFTFELPEGLTPEGLPDPVELDAGFAVYKSSTRAEGRELLYRREYRLVEPLLPASLFDEAVDFFLALGAEEQQSVLLKISDSRRP